MIIDGTFRDLEMVKGRMGKGQFPNEDNVTDHHQKV